MPAILKSVIIIAAASKRKILTAQILESRGVLHEVYPPTLNLAASAAVRMTLSAIVF
jgi:hypothetical protein